MAKQDNIDDRTDDQIIADAAESLRDAADALDRSRMDYDDDEDEYLIDDEDLEDDDEA